MTDYKKIADAMQAMPADRKVMSKKDFTHLMKIRNMKFVQDIDTVNNLKREVWGNSHFEIIICHDDNNYQVL